MGQRNITAKYIPPNFNPSEATKRSKPQNGQHDVRFMLPMTIKCSNCGFLMAMGTKANARKEIAYDQDYLGITVYRFYIHCKECYSEIIIKTDPQNSDYAVVAGATRHFEPWREFQQEHMQELKAKLQGSRINQVERTSYDKLRDANQASELEKLAQFRMHQRKLKLSDLKKIYAQNSEDILGLSEEDKKIVENFTEKSKEIPEKKQLKVLPLGNTKIWQNQDIEFDEV